MSTNTVENLSELLTKAINLADIYYDLFINPEQMDVTIQYYDSNGQLVEVEVPNRAKSIENVGSLVVSSFDSNSVSVFNNINYPTQVPDNIKLATDLSVSSSLPFCGESPLSVSIKDLDFQTEEFGEIGQEKFYNLGFEILKGEALVAESNTLVSWLPKYTTYGQYKVNSDLWLFTPDFKMQNVISDREQNTTVSSLVSSMEENVYRNRKIVPIRQYSAVFGNIESNFGLDKQNYVSNSDTQRSYSNLLCMRREPAWFVPITLYGVNITGYKDGEITRTWNDACVLDQGESGDPFEGDRVFSNWNSCNSTTETQYLVGMDNDDITVEYNGNVWECYQALGTEEPFTVATKDNVNPDANYKEVLPTKNLNLIVQEVEDSNENKGWVLSEFFNIWNKETGYINAPGNEVEDWQTIYKVNPSGWDDTLENTGDFKYTFKMFRVPDFEDTYLIAYKSYKLWNKADNSIIQWTIEEGLPSSSFSGMTADNPNEVQWAHKDNSIEWYEVEVQSGDNEGETLYVRSSDFEETPSVNDYVPESMSLYRNRLESDFVRDAGFEDTIITDNTPMTAFEYVDENEETPYIFIYENEERPDLEGYFSEDDWGIYINNFDDTYTKVDEGYQWFCDAWYSIEENEVKNYFPSYQNIIPNIQPQVDFSISGINWWLMQVWEIEDTESGDISYIGIPPTQDPAENGDYSEFAGKEISYAEIYPYLPVDADGYAIDCNSETTWTYTGNYNDDFLGRWTDLQSGEL